MLYFFQIVLCFAMLIVFINSSVQSQLLSTALPKPLATQTAIDTTYYVVVNADSAVGMQKKWKDQNGRLHYTIEGGYWQWADSLHTIIQLDSNNSLLKYNITGNTRWGGIIVADSFRVIGKKAYWRNKLENDSALYHNQFYWSQKTTPAEAEVQLSFLKRTGTHSMNLLPSGRRAYEQTDSAEVSNADGSKTVVYLMRFTGYGDSPYYAWFTADGSFFAEVWDFLGTVKKGFEHNWVGLYQKQKLSETNYFRQLSVKSLIKSDKGYAIANVDVFDAVNKKVLRHQTVLIEDRMIKSIRPFTGKTVRKGFTIIDGTGKFLMPGLWDSHAHASDYRGPMWIANGTTNLINMASDRAIPQLKRLAAADSILHPDISITSGFMEKPEGATEKTGIQVSSLEQALRAIDTFKAEGYDQIKLYNLIEKDWVAPLSQKAKQLGMRTTGHVPQFMTADMVIDRGYNEINHFWFVMKNFLIDTLDKQSFSVPSLFQLKGSTIDIQSDKVKSFISKLKNNKIVIDPTLIIAERALTQLPGQLAKAYAPVKDIIPIDLRREAEESWYYGEDTNVQKYSATWQKTKEMLLALYKGGVTLVVGTDSDKGALLREMEIYSEAGIPNPDILRMTTYVPASVHGKENEYGNVKEGLVANLILLDANPLENISNIRKLNLVFKNGKAYDPKKIKQEYGWKIE